jgi:hypothetical protein
MAPQLHLIMRVLDRKHLYWYRRNVTEKITGNAKRKAGQENEKGR